MNKLQRESLHRLIQRAPPELKDDADRLLPLLGVRRKGIRTLLPRPDQLPLMAA